MRKAFYAVIIGGGSFPRGAYPRSIISSADVIICCDSAVVTYLRHFPDRLPDMVIGDMDSTPQSFLKGYKGPWMRVADQETNDQTKAFNYLISNYRVLSRITFIGAVGKRTDHTIANLSLLTDYAATLTEKYRDKTEKERGNIPQIESVSDTETVFPLLDSGTFFCGQGRGVSLFSQDTTLRIKSKGLRWPTNDVRFSSWWKASLNHADCDIVSLKFSHPAPVLVVLSEP